jgi:predicted MFS family arabinose efflux permease
VGFAGVLLGVAGIVALLSLTLVWVGRGPVAVARPGVTSPDAGSAYPSAAGATAFFIWFAGISGVWVLLERVGNDSRIDPVTIGLVLSMSVLLGVVGALAAGILCDRAGRRRPHMVSAAAIVAAMLLLIGRPGLAQYTVATGLFVFFQNFWMAYLLGTLTSADQTGRFSSLFTAAIGLGATLRPQAAGAFIGGDSYAPVVFVCIAATLVGLVAALWLLAIARHDAHTLASTA